MAAEMTGMLAIKFAFIFAFPRALCRLIEMTCHEHHRFPNPGPRQRPDPN